MFLEISSYIFLYVDKVDKVHVSMIPFLLFVSWVVLTKDIVRASPLNVEGEH